MELVLRDKDEAPVAVIHPATGEVIDLAETTREQIAEWYLAMLDWQASAAQAVRIASKAFAQLTDREASLSVSINGRRVGVPGAADKFELDNELLREALVELVESGELSQQAADETCRPLGVDCPSCGEFVPTGGFKVNLRALNNLRKVPSLNTVIEACGERTPRPRPLQT